MGHGFKSSLLSLLALGLLFLAASPVVYAGTIYIGFLGFEPQRVGFFVVNGSGGLDRDFSNVLTRVEIGNFNLTVSGPVHDVTTVIEATGTFSPTTVTYQDLSSPTYTLHTVDIYPDFRIETNGSPFIGAGVDNIVAPITAQATPEPATWMLCSLALGGFLMFRSIRAAQCRRLFKMGKFRDEIGRP
jgi:hypothetical protein